MADNAPGPGDGNESVAGSDVTESSVAGSDVTESSVAGSDVTESSSGSVVLREMAVRRNAIVTRDRPVMDIVASPRRLEAAGANQALREKAQMESWSRRFYQISGLLQPPIDIQWPKRYRPSWPWTYSLPIFPNSIEGPGYVVNEFGPGGTPVDPRTGLALSFFTERIPEGPPTSAPPFVLPAVLIGMRDHDIRSCALHIAGSYTKIAYLTEISYNELDIREYFARGSLPQVHCAIFRTDELDGCLACLRGKGVEYVVATGPGATMRAEKIRELLTDRCQLELVDEGQCITFGARHFIQECANQVFTLSDEVDEDQGEHVGLGISYPKAQADGSDLPCLVVNVQADVSVYMVNQDGTMERLGGSDLGGPSYLAMALLLTGTQDLDDLADLCEGEEFVRDPDDGPRLSAADNAFRAALSPQDAASMFPFLAKPGTPAPAGSPDDLPHLEAGVTRHLVATAVVSKIAEEIAKLTREFTQARRCFNVYFIGLFQLSRPTGLNILNYHLHNRRGDRVEPRFFRHGNYIAAFGALNRGIVVNRGNDRFWADAHMIENFACSALPVEPLGVQSLVVFDVTLCGVARCPLLWPDSEYAAERDDLSLNHEFRRNAFKELWEGMDMIGCKAVETFEPMPQVLSRAHAAMRRFRQLIEHLWNTPISLGPLSMRMVLDIREQCLMQAGLIDPFILEKGETNEAALRRFPQYLANYIDRLEGAGRWRMLTMGLLQGNVFDLAEPTFASILMEAIGDEEPFEYFREHIYAHRRIGVLGGVSFDPESWVAHVMEEYTRYRKVAIVVDNAGFDFILGVMPFVRELLKDPGARVLLIGTSRSVLSGASHAHLTEVVEQVAALDELITYAYHDRRLTIHDSGQPSATLDLSRLHKDTAEQMVGCDLLVLLGVGRAVHTNYTYVDYPLPRFVDRRKAVFSCDSIRCAVIKSDSLAKCLGGDQMLDYIFEFVPSPYAPPPPPREGRLPPAAIERIRMIERVPDVARVFDIED